MFTRITIRERAKPLEPDPFRDIDWICKSLGFVSARDSEETASKIFRAIIDAMSRDMMLSSDDISEISGVTRGAVIHHLNSYISAGIIIHRNKKYILRTRSVESTVEELEREILHVLHDIKKIAREVDQRLGLKER